MKTEPIVPAHVEWPPGAPPFAPDFGDIYHPRTGAQLQAEQVFIAGNGLPGRWAGRSEFTILETGFGLGNNFLATWQAWRSDPQRCDRLFYVSIDKHPPTRADLERAHAASPWPDLAAQLIAAWPPLTPNLHPLSFDRDRARLLLGFGDITALLPELQARADAIYLDGFAPARNPAMWDLRVIKALARRAAHDATAATWSVSKTLRESLLTAGFVVTSGAGVGAKREITLARFASRFQTRDRATPEKPQARQALVLGAGLAGAFTAHALAEAGWAVTVIDRHALPAQGSSGNPAGLFHGTVHGDDGVHARLFRAAALLAQRRLHPWIAGGAVPGGAQGLLRMQDRSSLERMLSIVDQQRLPGDYVRVFDAGQASALAQLPHLSRGHPAWFYPGGGWVDPQALVRCLLDRPAIRFAGAIDVAGLRREGDEWVLEDECGRPVGSAPVLVLANAEGAGPLLAGLGHPPWPVRRFRGQVSSWSGGAGALAAPALPIVGSGYAIPLPGGGVLCGATSAENDDDTALRAIDQHANFERLLALTGLRPPHDSALWRGSVGWRLQADDRLPIVGPVPLARAEMPARQRLDQARLVPRTPGLYVATAFGGRGITLAPLAGQLLAAQICGLAWPLEQSLVDAMDPARWLVREVRRSA